MDSWIIEQCGFAESVDLRVENQRLIVSPERQPRQGWEAAFRGAGPAADDEFLLDGKLSNEFDDQDWRW